MGMAPRIVVGRCVMGIGNRIKRQIAKLEAKKAKELKRLNVLAWNTPKEIYREELWHVFTDQYYKMDYWIRSWDSLYGQWAYTRGYPNAGSMNAMDGSGRRWFPKHRAVVAICIGEDQNCPIDYRLEEPDAVQTMAQDLMIPVEQAGVIVATITTSIEDKYRRDRETRQGKEA